MSQHSREHPASDTEDHVTLESGGDDVYLQLAQREHELMLAAELGKALLEKNQELQIRIEQILEENNGKLEVLTQEKHGLKLKLDTMETEYQTTVREMQNDITLLTKALEEKDCDTRNGNKEKTGVIDELMQYNERIGEQLRKAHETEKELRSQLRTLHDEMDMRSHTTQDTIMCMDALNKQTSHLRHKKEELESKLRHLTEERSSLVESLDDWQDQCQEKEQLTGQQKKQICELEKSLEELRDRNQQLQQRLSSSHHGNSTVGSSDLYSELSKSGLTQAMSTESLDEPGRLNTQDWTPAPQYGMTFYGCDPSMFQDEDDDIEYDDVDYATTGELVTEMGCHGDQHTRGREDYRGNRGSESPVSQRTLTSEVSRDSLEEQELRQEILEVYRQLHHLVLDLRGKSEEWSPATLQPEEMKPGCVLAVLKELRKLVEDSSRAEDSSHQEVQSHLDSQEDRISRLQRRLVVAEGEVNKLAEELVFKEEQLLRRGEDVKTLARKLKHEQEVSSAVRRERDSLLDQQVTVTQREVIDRVRKERDTAIHRSNETELEVARSRLDMVHLDQQLLEAVQQKLELSQQLELWQVDMQELIDKQVAKRIKEEKKEHAKTHNTKTQHSSTVTSSKRFSLFRR